MAPIVTSPPPRGFTVVTAADGSLVVRYRNPYGWVWGLGCAVLLAVIILFVSGYIYEVLSDVFFGPSHGDGSPADLQYQSLPLGGKIAKLMVVLLVFLTFIVTIPFAIWLAMVWEGCLRTEFVFTPERLTVTQRVLGARRTWHVNHTDLRRVVQTGIDDEQWGWGLQIQTRWGTPVNVMSGPIRHTTVASEWLGPIMAQWAGVPFLPASDRR